MGQYIRDKGNEYGTTTGRPRRCGWFDAVVVSYAVKIGSIDEIVLLHLDTMSGLKEIQVCNAYEIDGKETTFFPSNIIRLAKARCVYETVPGWDEDITEAKNFDELPVNAKNYVKLIEKLIGRPIRMVGVGPKRTQTIYR
ncbi:MAG: hypothetical protein E4H40_02055 [Candidatus Brocadiia bacterium]|nr:MAG: hypothetical protein E4H40_02055 [Candidatus Brocadiia bacterium]